MGPVKAIDGRLVRSHFSAHAGEYDLYAAVQKRAIAHLCEQLDGEGAPVGRLLDVGTGTGGLATALSERYPEAAMTVMDLAHGMTRTAHARLPQASACDGDARRLPFADGSFALVASSSVYQWVPDLPAAFAEIHRVLQPGGCFALALFGEQTLCELRTAHRTAVAECAAERPSHVQSFPTRSEVAAALTAAGLDCRVMTSRMEVEFHADVPQLLRQLKQIGASNAAADRPRGLASRQVMQRMMACYEEQYRCAEGVPASYEVVVAIAMRQC